MRSNCFEKKAARHQLVHELRAQGLSYKQIQERTGFSQVSIWKYLKTTEPEVSPRRALSLARLEIAKQMKADGKTYRQIGAHFGLTAASALELIREGPAQVFSGVCCVCGRSRDDLIRHHTDYLKDEGELVCRECHIKHFHPDALNKAKSANADKRVDEKIAILEFMGWTELNVSIRDNGRRHITGRPPEYPKSIDAPNPLKDLNAIHLAEARLTEEQKIRYQEQITRMGLKDPSVSCWDLIHATAEVKSSALLAVIRP